MNEAQIRLAEAEQAAHGGSLDTAILALGYLTEAALQRLLARVWGVSGSDAYLVDPTPEAAALISAAEAARHRALPQRIDGKTVHVLARDPTALDALRHLPAFSGRMLVGVPVNEVRLSHHLDRCFSVLRSQREIEIMDRLMMQAVATARPGLGELDPLIGDPLAGLDPGFLAGAVVVRAPEAEPLDPDVIPLLEDELLTEITEEEPTTETEGEPEAAAARAPLARDEFESALTGLGSMDALPDIYFRFSQRHFPTFALFKVQSGMLMGWRGVGEKLVPAVLRGVVVPVGSDTFLARAIQHGTHVGQAGANAVEREIATHLGGDATAWVTACSLKVGDRPVLVVCGLSADKPADVAVLDLEKLSSLASHAVLQMIRAKKKG
jgi:hypothetical protein